MTRYHAAFFERGPAVDELETAFERIEEGEKRLELRREREEQRLQRQEERMKKRAEWELKRKEIQKRKLEKQKMAEQRVAEQEEKLKAVLIDRVEKWEEGVRDSNDGIWTEIQLPKGQDCGFTREVDRFLFLTTARLGYGEWSALHRAVGRHPLFFSNFWLKTQSPMELKQRVDTILRSCGGIKRKSKRTAAEMDTESNQGDRAQSLVREMENVQIAGDAEESQEPQAKKQRV